MSVERTLSAFAFVAFLGFGLRQTSLAQAGRRVTGTYTNMYYNKEGGDVLGEELKIVMTQGGRYQGVLEFAEGEPEDLIVVDIELRGDTISFSVPDTDTHAGRFSGTIANGTLRGQFRFKRGGIESVALKKGQELLGLRQCHKVANGGIEIVMPVDHMECTPTFTPTGISD